MVHVVKNLILRTRDVDRLIAVITLVVLRCHLLSEVENTGVRALGNFPFKLDGEVLELMSEDDIAALSTLSLTSA